MSLDSLLRRKPGGHFTPKDLVTKAEVCNAFGLYPLASSEWVAEKLGLSSAVSVGVCKFFLRVEFEAALAKHKALLNAVGHFLLAIETLSEDIDCAQQKLDGVHGQLKAAVAFLDTFSS